MVFPISHVLSFCLSDIIRATAPFEFECKKKVLIL